MDISGGSQVRKLASDRGRADAGEVAEPCVRVEGKDDAVALQSVRSDDQLMCAAGLTGPAGVGDQARMAGGGGVGVVKHVERPR